MCTGMKVVAPAGSRAQLQRCSSESLKNSFSSQLPSLFIDDCYSELWITIISSSRSIIFPSLIKTEAGTWVSSPRVWVFPLFSKPRALISRTYMDPAGIYVRSSKSSMFSLYKFLPKAFGFSWGNEIQRDHDLAVAGHAQKVFCQYKWHFNHQDIFFCTSTIPEGFCTRGPRAGQASTPWSSQQLWPELLWQLCHQSCVN